jgi:ABC-type nickel/cobalt efflux system permease component RcnA
VTIPANSTESRYGKGLQFQYSHAALAVFIVGLVLTIVPTGSAAVTLAGCAVLWLGLYLFMKESTKTIRWFATPMIAIFGWFIIASASGSMARWAPAGHAGAVEAEAAQPTTTGAALNADVRLTGAQFLVTDRGQQPWTDVSLSLTGSDHGAYETRIDRVDAGQTVVVQLSRFATADGHPFRTATTKAQALTIEAHAGVGGEPGTYTVRLR